MEDEDNIFAGAEVSEELSSEEELPIEADEEWIPSVSDESPKAKLERKGEKKEANGKVYTIKSWFFTRPKTKGIDGKKIEPKETQNGKPFYAGKLGIRFAEENLVEYYPTMRYFVSDQGQMQRNAKLNRTGDSAITKLVNLVVKKMNRPLDEVSDSEILAFLIGKKVTLVTVKGTYKGKAWFRNDISQFVD